MHVNESAYDVYDISVQLQTPLSEFSEFVSHNYAQFKIPDVDEPTIDVKYSEQAGEEAAERKSELRFFGEGVYLDDGALYWENKFGFRTLLTLEENDQLTVRAFHTNLLKESDPDERFKDFQRSMRWAIHFPIFTRLQYRRNWSLIHAAAVAKDDAVVVFCGLNKVGKSTLAVHLCQERGYDLVTDNFLLVGDGQVYGFPEVVRLSPTAADRMGLSSLWDDLVYGKYHVNSAELGVTLSGVPTAFFFVNQGDKLMTRQMDAEVGWETMRHLHGYLGEFPEQSYLGFWPYLTEETMNDVEVTETITNTPWYELTYEPDWDLAAVSREVQLCI